MHKVSLYKRHKQLCSCYVRHMLQYMSRAGICLGKSTPGGGA